MPRRFWEFVGTVSRRLKSAPATGAHGATSGIDRAASDGLTTTENPHGVDDVGDGVFASSALAARWMASAAALPLTKATRADPMNGSRWRGREHRDWRGKASKGQA